MKRPSKVEGEAHCQKNMLSTLCVFFLSFFLSFLCLVMEHFQLCQGEGDDGKTLTAKQLEAKLKREARKAQCRRKPRPPSRREAERKKNARAANKKTLALSTRLAAPLAAAWKPASDLLEQTKDKNLDQARHLLTEFYLGPSWYISEYTLPMRRNLVGALQWLSS